MARGDLHRGFIVRENCKEDLLSRKNATENEFLKLFEMRISTIINIHHGNSDRKSTIHAMYRMLNQDFFKSCFVSNIAIVMMYEQEQVS